MPELGEWIEFNAIARKSQTREYGRNKHHRYVTTRWIKQPCEPFQAMYIGCRTVFDVNFYRYSDRYETDEEMSHIRHHTVWLVVKNGRTNPIYVFPREVMR